jgi:hypothetical protein
MTFWLFTHKDGTYLKGEGQTDREALGLVVEQIKARIIASGGDSFLDMFLTPDNPPED